MTHCVAILKEIHGYRPELGLRVFTDAAMGRQKTGTAMGGMRAGQATSPKTQTSSSRDIGSSSIKGKKK